MENNSQIDQLLNLKQQLNIAEREDLREYLILYINDLLLRDFNKLVQLLYKADIDEKNLKELLQKTPQSDAAVIITDMLIKRQEEKIISRQQFTASDDIPDDERW